MHSLTKNIIDRMKKIALFLLSAMSLPLILTGCANDSQKQNGSDGDSTAVVVEQVADEPAEPKDIEVKGMVVDEMMSTLTLMTEDGDTVVYVKGSDFESDAAIGDKVVVTLNNENDEQEVLQVKRI